MFDLRIVTKQKYIFFVFILFAFLFILGYSTTSNSIDPDFGWHLRTGQLILERGVPKVDWYSYTMPNFPWIDHEWLSDVFIYKIYSLFGFQFLLAVFLVIFTLAFFILIRRELFFYFLLPVVLGYLASISFLGIRPQLWTVFFVAILLFILNKFSENPSTRLIYLCPVLFLIWANLHGGFIIGLLFIFLYLALEVFKKTGLFRKIISSKIFSGQNYREASYKKIKALLALFVISIIFTFINPYGPGLYKSVDFMSAGDFFLKSHISEWMPLFSTGFQIFPVLYLGFFLGLMVIFYKKVEFNNLALSLAFLFFAVSSQRNLLIFIVLTVPIFAEMSFYFKDKCDQQKIRIFFEPFQKLAVILIISELFLFGFYPYLKSNIEAKNYNSYPAKAADFIKKIPLSENLLNEYNWGGYLIWKLPERKVFIDGRMPSWRANGQFAFGDYIKIMGAQDGVEGLLAKYNVKIALLSKNEKDKAVNYTDYQSKPKSQLTKFFAQHNWSCQLFGICYPSKNIYNELTDSGWRIVYQDNVAVILEK